MDNIKNKLSGNVGALSGLQKKVDKLEVKENENIKDKKEGLEIVDKEVMEENTEDEYIEEVKIDTDNKIANILNKKNKKTKLKLATYNLREDQIEDLSKLAKKSGMQLNQFMRESLDVLIEQFEEALKQ